MTEDQQPMLDKRKKAHPTEIDISNGALFLRIADLERKVTYLMKEVDKLRQHNTDPVAHNIRIG